LIVFKGFGGLESGIKSLDSLDSLQRGMQVAIAPPPYIYTMLYILRRFRVCTRLGRGFKDYTGKGLGEDILFPPLLKREM